MEVSFKRRVKMSKDINPRLHTRDTNDVSPLIIFPNGTRILTP